MKIDLDAARAARREAAGEAPVIVIGGQEVELPAEIPFEAAAQMGAMAKAVEAKDNDALTDYFGAWLRTLLGDAYDAFMAARPSVNDLMALSEGLVKAYGFEDLGESPASATS